MFFPASPMNRVSDQNRDLAQRRGTLRSMQSSAQLHTQPSVSGLALVELDSPAAAFHVVGVSAVWRKLLMQAEMAAPHLQVASIEGEHGSGKYTLARYLFSRSPLVSTSFQRRDAREWLATDADPAALAGFTYLDRVDLLAPPGQGLLLGVLKTLQDRPPGRGVLLASSQTSLRQMAGQGLLLPDLAFRLTAIRFGIPPLRQRREDIAPLAQFLLDGLCARYQQRPVVLGPGTLARLLQHTWPGNVRELLSALENALLEADNGVIRPIDLALPDGTQHYFDLQSGAHSPLSPAMAPGTGFSADGFEAGFGPPAAIHPADLSLDAIIRRHVKYVLELNRGNKLRTARQLQISRSTLYRILANENFLAR
jgi:DNA-binding NtrC family response regulator